MILLLNGQKKGDVILLYKHKFLIPQTMNKTHKYAKSGTIENITQNMHISVTTMVYDGYKHQIPTH